MRQRTEIIFAVMSGSECAYGGVSMAAWARSTADLLLFCM